MNRRTLMQAALSAVGLSATTIPTWAQQQPVKILVGFPPGGSADGVARVLAEGMSQRLGRTVIVENRPGAGGQIAANALKQSPPDGNTLFLSNNHTLCMIPLTVRNPGYDTLKDFTAVGLVSISPGVLIINPKLVGEDVVDIAGLIAWFRANPERASVGVPAPVSAPEFMVRLLSIRFNLDINPVPYRGDGPVVQDMLAGHIPAGSGTVSAALPHVRAGTLRIIAVDSTERLAALPDVPTYVEQGIEGYDVSNIAAMMAPAGTPQDVIARYNAVITEVVQSPAFTERLAAISLLAASSTPEELTTRIRDTNAAFAAIVKRTGFKLSY